MRVLMVGDLHGRIVHAQYVVQTAYRQKCMKVVQLGDFGYWAHTKPGEEFLQRLDQFCNIRGVTFYWVDGNHDNVEHLLQHYTERDHEGFIKIGDYIRYAPRGHRWTWDGSRFIALGGAYSVDKDDRISDERAKEKIEGVPEYSLTGHYWFPGEEMTDLEMAAILQNTEPVDVMLAHDMPRGSDPSWNRKAYLECLANQDRLKWAVRTLTPKYYFHGHLHFWYKYPLMYSGPDGQAQMTAVTGLQCDVENAVTPGYHREQSWQVFDTKEVTDVVWPDVVGLWLHRYGGDEPAQWPG